MTQGRRLVTGAAKSGRGGGGAGDESPPLGHRPSAAPPFACPARLLAASLALLSAVAGPARAAEAPASEPILVVGGQPYVEATALARLLKATRFARTDVRKLMLRAGSHRIVLTADNPFVVIDSRTVRLPAPVRVSGGEFQVPVALADSLPRDSTIARVVFEPRGRRVVLVPPGGVIGTPRITQTEAVSRVIFACDRPEDARVVGRSRDHFRLHLDGFFAGFLPDSIAEPGMVRGVRQISAATGSGFELVITGEAEGWRLIRGADRITLEIVKIAGAEHESFAPEGPPGPRALRVIVLDPGHGGRDFGVTAGGVQEKSLALQLAGALKIELERRLEARVFLTRETDAAMTPEQRAEAANRVHADLVLSLHFDGVPGTRARGVTAICPPATYGARQRAAAPNATPIEILPWRDVATRHAVRARDIAETLLATLELRGQGPARLRERLPVPLLGVNAPGLLLECGTLTSPADLARLQSAGGIARLAAAIAEGLQHWQTEG